MQKIIMETHQYIGPHTEVIFRLYFENLKCAFICFQILCADRANTATILIASGADVNAKDNDGYSPLHFVALYGK